MLQLFSSKSFALRIGKRKIAFNSLDEFEYSLAGLTNIPAGKIVDLLSLTTRELEAEAKSIRRIEKQLVEILSETMNSPDNIDEALRSLDPFIFSQDHDWREIFIALNEKKPAFREQRRIALVKYIQYLASRQELIRQRYLDIQKVSTGALLSDRGSENDRKKSDDTLIETMILEAAGIAAETKQSHLGRLPKGEAVKIPQLIQGKLEIHLASHQFTLLVDGEKMKLVDDAGKAHPVDQERIVIGRGKQCDIQSDHSHHQVSRLHLVLERLKDGGISLTDLSSHGTFIPTQFIKN